MTVHEEGRPPTPYPDLSHMSTCPTAKVLHGTVTGRSPSFSGCHRGFGLRSRLRRSHRTLGFCPKGRHHGLPWPALNSGRDYNASRFIAHPGRRRPLR